MGLINKQDAIDAIKAIPRLILDSKGEFQPVDPPTKAMIDPDDALWVIENLPLAKPDFDSVVKLDKAFDDGYNQGYLQAESDLSISLAYENDLISRRAAIDALEHKLADPQYYHTGENWYVGVNCAESEIYELPSGRLDNQVHLCNSCKYEFPVCPIKNDDIVFGNGVGDDNICACSKYVPSVQSDHITENALRLLLEWAIECGFGYDNLGDLYDKYKDDIKSMSYSDGLVYIAKMEVLKDE